MNILPINNHSINTDLKTAAPLHFAAVFRPVMLAFYRFPALLDLLLKPYLNSKGRAFFIFLMLSLSRPGVFAPVNIIT